MSPASKHTAPKWCRESADRIIDAIRWNAKQGMRELNAEEFADLIEDEYSRAANNHERLVEALTNLLGYLREMFPDEPLFSDDPNKQGIEIHKVEAALAAAREGE